MPLESCPTCGSALSILSHQCRNCLATTSKLAWIGWLDGMSVLHYALVLIALIGACYILLHL